MNPRPEPVGEPRPAPLPGLPPDPLTPSARMSDAVGGPSEGVYCSSMEAEDCDALQEEADAEESQADAQPVSRLAGQPGCVAQNLLPLHRIILWDKRQWHRRRCITGGEEDQGAEHTRRRRGERQPIAEIEHAPIRRSRHGMSQRL